MRARSIAALGVLVAGIAWLPAPAHAQGKLTKAQIAEARQHYLAATEAEKKGSYDAAIREFIAAYDITMDPVLFYQIAKAHELAGHLDDALTFYRRYLAEAQVSGEGQTDVSARITDLEKKKQARDTARPGDGGAGAGGDEGGGDTLLPPGGGDEGGGDGGLGGGDGAPPTFMDSGSRWQRTAAWVSVGLAAGFPVSLSDERRACSKRARASAVSLRATSRAPCSERTLSWSARVPPASLYASTATTRAISETSNASLAMSSLRPDTIDSSRAHPYLSLRRWRRRAARWRARWPS